MMDLHTSIRRTIIPMVMGWLASLPVAPFLDLAALEGVIVVLLGSVYYSGLRWLESRGVEAAGWWLAFGRTSQPEYQGVGE